MKRFVIAVLMALVAFGSVGVAVADQVITLATGLNSIQVD